MFDLIVVMDCDNLDLFCFFFLDLSGRFCFFFEFLDDVWLIDVFDLYYGGDDGFEYVFDMIELVCLVILECWKNVFMCSVGD